MLELLIILLVLAWFGGLLAHVGGDLINLLLVIAAVVFIVRLLRGERL